MKIVKNKTSVLCVIAVSLLLSACSTLWPASDQSRSSTNHFAHDLIAQNLLFALAQVEGLSPLQTTVQTPIDSPNEFASVVISRVKDAGYGVQKVLQPAGTHYVTTLDDNDGDSNGQPTLYRVAIGKVAANRLYTVTSDKITPVSAISINGASEADIRLNDDIFENSQLDQSVSSVAFAGLDSTGASRIHNSALSPTAGSSLSASASQHNKVNVFDQMTSNYAPMFTRYEDYETATIVFWDDSLVLRRTGKKTIRELVSIINSETDVISILGCSHGSSGIENGNQILALGRANRVKEEFMYAGIPHNLILEEGCWSAARFDEVMPRRAVLITVKRLAG